MPQNMAVQLYMALDLLLNTGVITDELLTANMYWDENVN